jgi:crossover junction endodeoxyribonuclease RuvC
MTIRKPPEPRPGRETEAAEPCLCLGIDPGSRVTGFGLVERQGRKLRLVAHGCIRLPAALELADKLARIHREIGLLIADHRPHQVAVEAPFQGINPRSLIVLAQARGAALAAVAAGGLRVVELTPSEIKASVVGSGAGDKTQVEKMVRLILGIQGGAMKPDESDALAAAICLAQRRDRWLKPLAAAVAEEPAAALEKGR